VPKVQTVLLRDYGIMAGIDRVRRLMRLMGLMALYPKPNLSKPSPAYKYPYLLKNLVIIRPNQVWATDITYIRLKRGFAYLVAIIDWYSRYVLSWRLSQTLELPFCLDALNEAIRIYGMPEIFNSDQGSHFTAEDWISILKANKIRISMDGRGRCWDNIFTERFWRSLKCENVYIKGYSTFAEALPGIAEYMILYNTFRPHESLGNRTPHETHFAEKRSSTIAQERRNESETTCGSSQKPAEGEQEKQLSLFGATALAADQSDRPILTPYII
jgi:putative transposase